MNSPRPNPSAPTSAPPEDRAGKSKRRSSKFPGRGTARPRPNSEALRAHAGAILRMQRQQAGLSLRRLGAASGVSHAEICKIELGLQNCTLKSFVQICSALGAAPDQILGEVLRRARL